MGAYDTVKVSKLLKLLKAYGFEKKRQKGSHISFSKPGIARPIVLALHGKEVPFYLVKELIRVLHMTPKQFLTALNKYK